MSPVGKASNEEGLFRVFLEVEGRDCRERSVRSIQCQILDAGGQGIIGRGGSRSISVDTLFDADPYSDLGIDAQDATARFTNEFVAHLVENYGAAGAVDSLLRLQSASQKLSRWQIIEIGKAGKAIGFEIEKTGREKTRASFETLGGSEIDKEKRRQCGFGNPAACPD